MSTADADLDQDVRVAITLACITYLSVMAQRRTAKASPSSGDWITG